MRGRTNVTSSGGEAVVNGKLEEFIVSGTDSIKKGDFVEIYYAQNFTNNFFGNSEGKYVADLKDGRILICYKLGNGGGNWVLNLFGWDGDFLNKLTQETKVIDDSSEYSYTKNLIFIKETENWYYFAFCTSSKKVYIIRVNKSSDFIEFRAFAFSYESTVLGYDSERSVSASTEMWGLAADNSQMYLVLHVDVRYQQLGTDNVWRYVNKYGFQCVKIDYEIVEENNNFDCTFESSMNYDRTGDYNYYFSYPPYIVKKENNVCTLYFTSGNYEKFSSTYMHKSFLSCLEVNDINSNSITCNFFNIKESISHSNFTGIYYSNICKVSDGVFLFATSDTEKETFLVGDISYEVNFISTVSSNRNDIQYCWIKDGVVFGFYCSNNRLYSQLLLYDNVSKSTKVVPSNVLMSNVSGIENLKTFPSACLLCNNKILLLIGKGYYVFEFNDNELHFGEMDANRVKKWSGNYCALGFSKTAGEVGDTIKVYVPVANS